LLIDKNKIKNIKVGNIEENFDIIKKADWVVEAVVERIDIKHNIYEKIQTMSIFFCKLDIIIYYLKYFYY